MKLGNHSPEDRPPKAGSGGGGIDPGELFARALNTVQPSAGAASWTPPTPEALAPLLPQYRIEKMIGRGGMGAVYKAVQLNLDRLVAIKLLPVEVAEDAEFVTRFKREAKTLAKLQHSRIVTIHDFGQTSEGHLYFVMEYIDGTNLREIMRGPGLSPEQALIAVGQICDALQAAHREGIVHRDIKPENVLISREGYVKLADFGIARPPKEEGATEITSADVVMGTADYMAPEQRAGAKKADHRSDIFALGVMFYEMLTGQRPQGVFDPPSHKVQVDVRIDGVVLRALQSEPERRYQLASEMRTDVERIRTTPQPVQPAVKKPQPTVAARKPGRKLQFAAVIALLLLGIAGTVLWPKILSWYSGQGGGEAGGAGPIKATKDAPFVNSLGMKFVPVPILGGPTSGQRVLFSVWDTRVQDYEAFVKETKREWPKPAPKFDQGPTHPAVMVSWDDAQAFSVWLTGRERKAGNISANESYRLPSDHEWSCAVGIGDREDSTKTPSEKRFKIHGEYPWGNQWPPPVGAGNYAGEELRTEGAVLKYPDIKITAGYSDGFVNTSPVGSFNANRFGLFDIGGNVLQLCEDWSDKDQKIRVGRGNSWRDSANADISKEHFYLLSSNRGYCLPGQRHDDWGFRCVLAPTTSTAPGAGATVQALSATTTNATKDKPFVNTLGMRFVPVPIVSGPTAGQRVLFGVWDVRVEDYAAYAKAQESAGKKVDGSWKTQHRDGVSAGRELDHPVVGVNWEDAQTFCKWLTEKESAEGKLPRGLKYRLPSDEEWSWAVGLPPELGGTPAEKSGKNSVDFPWGKDWPPTKKAGNYADEAFHAKFPKDGTDKPKDQPWIKDYTDGYATTSPVGSFPANAYGLYDMGGNVWQWCEDWLDKDQKDRVVRGASWYVYDRGYLLSSNRVHNAPGSRNHSIGFRCVLGESAR